MESLQSTPMYNQTRISFMTSFRPRISLTSISFKTLCTSSVTLTQTQNLNPSQTEIPPKPAQKNSSGRRIKAFDAELKKNWLASLSYPFPENAQILDKEMDLAHKNEGSEWVIGIDPDVSGAVALLKSDGSGCTAQVFDSPSVQILVGKRTRRRLDAKSIVQLVRSFDAPVGTTAYIEQSIVFPQDGKQGWWSGGFGYGLWIGILVASGFSVVPLPSFTWKTKFELSGSKAKKDDSRRVASMLFPSLSSLLKRKKDHGRAEALLIAAYGKAHKNKSDSSFNLILENMES